MTDEMIERLVVRTRRHIALVAMNLARLEGDASIRRAIAQEATGVGSARPWAEQNISRWQFSPTVRDFVFATIDELDRRNGLESRSAA